MIGAEVKLCDEAGAVVASCETDEFGDFMFDQVEAAKYTVGFNGKTVDADATDKDLNLGDMAY